MIKITLTVIIVVISIAFIGFPHSFPDPSTKATISVKTDKATYNIGDTIVINGSVINAASDKVVLKIFNTKEELVWLFEVNLDKNHTFETTLPLSDPVWNGSAFYVLTAKTNETIGATSFEINQTSNSEEITSSVISRTLDKFLQSSLFLSVAVIFIIGITVYALYTKRGKNTGRVKHESLPLITFDAPSPAKVHLRSGTYMSYEGWHQIPKDQRPKIDSIEIWIAIKNIGRGNAENITALFFQNDKVFSRQDMEEENIDKQISLPELVMDEFYYWNFEISWDRFVRLERDSLFVGLLVSYNKDKNHSGIIFEIGKEGSYTADEWFTH